MSIHFDFDEKRATHAAAYLIKLAGGQLNYLKMVKMLYFADRYSILHYGYPISGGNYFSMKMGPVVSEIMDAAKNNNNKYSYWASVIHKRSNTMSMSKDIDTDELSKNDEKALEEVFLALRKLTHRELIDGYCHDGKKTPEWTRIEDDSRAPLKVEKILRTLGGNPEDQIMQVTANAELAEKLNALRETQPVASR